MSANKYPLSFPAEDASAWRRIRKYAVPRWMIEQATERRLAGDWRGACAAANIDVAFDLTEIVNEHGAGIATTLEEDLHYLAPDLIRWHLPRYLQGRTTLRPRQNVLLAGYGDQPSAGPYLVALTPPMIDGPQRLTLRFGDIIEHGDVPQNEDRYNVGLREERLREWRLQTQNWITSRHLWDARRVNELRAHHGTQRHSGWVTQLHDRGELGQALAVAGVVMDEASSEKLESSGHYYGPPLRTIVSRLPLDLTRIEPEIGYLRASGFGTAYQVERPTRWSRWGRLIISAAPGSGPVISVASSSRFGDRDFQDLPVLPEACWRRLPDYDLLDFGDITPDRLHPLVSASLFPERSPQLSDGPPQPGLPLSAPVRARCRDEWHEIHADSNGLRTVHGPGEEQRERAMQALGGAVTGCFAVQQAWMTGTGWLPRALRDQQREFFSRIQHGDTPGVIRLLDAGVDPRIRNGRQQTLLHLLHLIDYDVLLPRLLAAGLDLEARDHHQQTPLYVAVNHGPARLVKALLDAGARTDVADEHTRRNLADIIVWQEREDLPFLADVVRQYYPNPGSPRMTRSRPFG